MDMHTNNAHLAGSLETMPLVDLLQMLAGPDRQGVLKVTTTDGSVAQVRIVGDRIVNETNLTLLIENGVTFTWRSTVGAPAGERADQVQLALLRAMAA